MICSSIFMTFRSYNFFEKFNLFHIYPFRFSPGVLHNGRPMPQAKLPFFCELVQLGGQTGAHTLSHHQHQYQGVETLSLVHQTGDNTFITTSTYFCHNNINRSRNTLLTTSRMSCDTFTTTSNRRHTFITTSNI